MSNIEELSFDELVDYKKFAEENIKKWKLQLEATNAQLLIATGGTQILRDTGKLLSGGSKTFEFNGYKFSVAADKTIKWDSTKLAEVASKLPWPMVKNLFKIKFEIPEKTYSTLEGNVAAGMFSKDLYAEINESRTVVIGEPKIESAEKIGE